MGFFEQIARPQTLGVVAIGFAFFCANATRGEGVQEWVAKEVPQLTQLYESLHQTPELSLQEEKTAARMAELLRAAGFSVSEGVGGHGVVGVLENGAGKTLMLRADMDALPVAEETGLAYASKVRTTDERGATVGVMHACGHDMHMTNVVGAAEYLAEHRQQWQGTLVVIFQPAEEIGAGAQAMIEAGLLVKFPRPDYGLALHVSASKPTGTVGYRPGYAGANVDSVDITIHGRGGHGAYPHMTIDPVVIAARLVLDLQTIVSREVDPIEPSVITVGAINGGSKHNIIGDTCELQLTVRSYTPAVREQLLEAIRRKALAAAQSAGAREPEVTVSEGTPALFNDVALTERVVQALRPVLGEAKVVEAAATMGGEDFGRFGLAGVPIVMLQLGVVDAARLQEFKDAGTEPHSLHSPKFSLDPPESITTGVTTLATAALELLPVAKD